MIATPRFVFLHLHKSGGSFVNELLLTCIPGARQLGYHLPRSLIPPELAALPVLGFVRNPWSYYVSWYTFQASRREPNALYRTLSDQGRNDFAATIRNMLALGDDEALLERVLAVLPRTYSNRGLNLPAHALASIRHSGMGFYSFLYAYLYGPPENLHIGRMESLREDLRTLFAKVAQPIDAQAERFIAQEPPRNTSSHADFRSQYDDDLARAVATRDAALVDRYGYTFTRGPAASSM